MCTTVKFGRSKRNRDEKLSLIFDFRQSIFLLHVIILRVVPLTAASFFTYPNGVNVQFTIRFNILKKKKQLSNSLYVMLNYMSTAKLFSFSVPIFMCDQWNFSSGKRNCEKKKTRKKRASRWIRSLAR